MLVAEMLRECKVMDPAADESLLLQRVPSEARLQLVGRLVGHLGDKYAATSFFDLYRKHLSFPKKASPRYEALQSNSEAWAAMQDRQALVKKLRVSSHMRPTTSRAKRQRNECSGVVDSLSSTKRQQHTTSAGK
jgi:hypothetical protein